MVLYRFKCVLKLVEGSIGISQVADTSLSRSARVSILLASSVIRFLLFSGLVDENDEVGVYFLCYYLLTLPFVFALYM